ncbi:MAG: hypothetical protein HQM14_15385 [SAR324 cluster bacterium]|nr:hypothetical protein [SAR324 cluster bacterium]
MPTLTFHWKQHWPKWVIVFFVLFQFGDVFFGNGTRSTFQNSPAAWVYEIPKYHGVFEGGSLNRFPREHTGARAFWDQPLVNDPEIKATNEILLSGEFPWINPYLGLGIPLFGNGVDSTFFIGTAVMAFLNSMYWDWVYLVLFFISGFLLFQTLHRYYYLEPASSLIGTLIYLSSALFAPQMVNGGESFNIYCFTFGVYFVEVFCSTSSNRSKILAAFAIILCVTQSSYAAMSEGTVATYFMLCAYLLLRLPLWPIKALWQSGLWIFTIFSISLLLSAPYLVTLHYNSGFMPHAHKIGHITIPLLYFPDLFLPYFRGWAQNDFFQGAFPNQLNVIFIGLVPLITFLFWISHYSQFYNKKKWLVFFLIVVFYVSQSFGPKAFNFNIVGQIPILDLIWFWRFFPPLYVFAAALLSAKVLHDLHSGKLTSIRYRFIFLLWVGVAVYFFLLNYWASQAAAWQNDTSVIAEFIKWNKTNTSFVCVFAVLFSLWSPWFQRKRWWPVFRKYWTVILISTVFLYSSYNFSKSFYHKQDAFEETPGIAFLKNKLRQGELFRIYSPNVYFPSTASGYGIPDIRYMAPITSQNTTDTLSSIFGDYGKGQVAWDRFESIHELDGALTYQHPGFDILNVRYFPFSPSHPNIPSGSDFREVYRDKHVVIVENLNAKNRVFFVSQWETLPGRSQVLQTIKENPQLLMQKALFYDSPVWPKIELPPSFSNLPPQLLNRTNQGYLLKIHLKNPQVLVISDAHYEGYQASINGQKILMQPVNGGLIGLALPAGEYQLDIHFEHPFAKLSFSLFALGVLICLIIGVALWWNSARLKSVQKPV